MKNKGLQTKIGIIGGGQLGKMMALEAKKMGFYVAILDPTEHCPAHSIVDEHIIAPFDKPEAVRTLAVKCDVLTYEFEHIDCDTLLQLEAEGVKIYPTAKSLSLIRDKLLQKQTLQNGGAPVPDFVGVSNMNELRAAAAAFGYPLMLKACTGGYDGKGNFVIRNEDELDSGYEALGGGKLLLMAERFVPFQMEASVLACRAADGCIAVYPVGQNLHEDNILIETKVPAELTQKTRERAMVIAERVMKIFEGVGMFCVELFILADGSVLVNEVAPRPHNSGHYSIEGCVTSQFEQHIRAVAELPLGDVSLVRPTVMRNLLGADGHFGRAVVEGEAQALAVAGAKLHIYGKEETKPQRKMGHLTVTAETVEKAAMLAEAAWQAIRIVTEDAK